jgi:hypothetical protein
MKKRIKRVSILQLGVVLATFYAALSLVIFVPFFLFFLLGAGASIPAFPITPGQQPVHMPNVASLSMAMDIVLMVLIPCLYALLGFIFGVISAIIYNIIAMLTGGVEFTVEDAA